MVSKREVREGRSQAGEGRRVRLGHKDRRKEQADKFQEKPAVHNLTGALPPELVNRRGAGPTEDQDSKPRVAGWCLAAEKDCGWTCTYASHLSSRSPHANGDHQFIWGLRVAGQPREACPSAPAKGSAAAARGRQLLHPQWQESLFGGFGCVFFIDQTMSKKKVLPLVKGKISSKFHK